MMNTESQGGYIVPQKYKLPKRGFIAWLKRLLKKDDGWRYVNLQEEIMEVMKNSKIEKSNRSKS